MKQIKSGYRKEGGLLLWEGRGCDTGVGLGAPVDYSSRGHPGCHQHLERQEEAWQDIQRDRNQIAIYNPAKTIFFFK